MGVYTEGYAQIVFKTTEAADEAAETALSIGELSRVAEEDFKGSSNYYEQFQYGNQIDIQFDSNRYPNAAWQADLLTLQCEKFKDQIEQLTISLTQPQTEVFLHQDDEEGMEEVFKSIKERINK